VRYLLDSDVCIPFLKGSDAQLRDRILALEEEEGALCSVVRAELAFGARHSRRVDSNLKRVTELFEMFRSMPFDDAAADHYGVVRAQLEQSGTPIGGNDLMIASIALAGDLTLVSRSVSEFRRVAGLRIERW
jgi:tRNA(fMet)-specific endonuclease VapC